MEIKKQHFTSEEDNILKQLVLKLGTKNWTKVANQMPNRTARQCREHWNYYLNPSINKDPWTSKENVLLLEKQKEFGNKWTQISKFFKKRTAIQLKNHWRLLNEKNLKIKTQVQPRTIKKSQTTSSDDLQQKNKNLDEFLNKMCDVYKDFDCSFLQFGFDPDFVYKHNF